VNEGHTAPEGLATSNAEAQGGLFSASFLGLLFTQTLTAINDNIFRWLAIGIGKDYVEPKDQARVLMAGTACFVLPYILLAAPAGYLADRFGKRDVIFVCKVAEIVLMILGVIAIVQGSLVSVFIILALMGGQAALFSPSKLGCIPELLRPTRIPAANGLFGLATVAATIVGMAVGSQLTDLTGYRGQKNWWISAAVLIGVAAIGTAFSLMIRRTPARNPKRKFPWNAVSQTIQDLRTLCANRALLRVTLGLVFFWSLGSLAQLNIDQFAAEGNATTEVAKTPMLAALVLGVGVGSVLAGILSHGRIELGILPIGALGVSLSSMLLFTVQGEIFNPSNDAEISGALIWACILLFGLGTSAGLFSVPLESYLQHRSPVQHRGSILAAANFLIFLGVFLFSILFYGLRLPILENNRPLFSARQIFLLAGLGTIPVLFYIVWVIPQASVRFLVWLMSHTLYRIRVQNREYLPEAGGAVLANQ
jgi:acyl-[acyl-carrier-protein]-phospholipid O-acyltransferase/long-chain-fatty-acid--[acyl-carrier-protein] ligase